MLERIRAEGPLSSREFERETGPTKDWFGVPENAVRAVLEAYTVTGMVGLARRDGTKKFQRPATDRSLLFRAEVEGTVSTPDTR